MDFANDDDFKSSWISNKEVKNPFYEIDFKREQAFNTIVIAEEKANIKNYRLEYFVEGQWKPLTNGTQAGNIKVHRFNRVWGSKVRVWINQYDHQPSIAEFEVYNERR